MVDPYSRNVLKIVVAQICQTIGWRAIQSTPLELLTDVFQKYIHELGCTAHRYGEQFGHTVPTLDDMGLAFKDMEISISELEEYVEYVASVPCEIQVPKYPLERESHLNLLKPGSREVVTRPVHIHEHLPAMHPQLEEEDYSFKQTSLSVDSNPNHETISPPLSSPKTDLFKRPGDPVSFEAHSVKKTRLLLEEEGRPLREISSVMMTTSGFLSPAREGKLPESCTPMRLFDSRSDTPQPLSYPAVPPEVKGEKKLKKNPLKVGIDSTKKLFDKKNSKSKEGPSLDVQKVETVDNDNDDINVKKLVSMKELTKLKALKPGAMKMLAQNNSSPGSVTKTKSAKHIKTPINNLNRPISIPKITKVNQAISPKKDKVSSSSTKVSNAIDKNKDTFTGVVDGKISSEPDKQKLNLLKKISKVKEEKIDPSLSDVGKNSRECSPISTALEIDNNKQREVRWAQNSETIEAVIQRSKELYAEPQSKLEPEDIESSESQLFPYDDNIPPPGTPTTPRTPDLIIVPRKSEKSADSKKKRKDKNKERKASRDRSTKSPSSPRRFRSESLDTDYMMIDKPKTPDVELSRDDVQPSPVFPFFPHYPTTPGLIPPPISHVFFPRMNVPMMKPRCLVPSHPSMPNLPRPPPLLLQPRETVHTKQKKSAPARSPPAPTVLPPIPSPNPIPSITNTSSIRKSVTPDKPAPQQSPPKGKNSEKEKKKEHKKEKKDKIKKKKDKKYKLKNKEKSGKRKEKGKKKDREKNKKKKEKKKREKEREEKEKLELSVPKITLKFGPASPQKPPTPEPPQRKIVIKPVVKKVEDVVRAGPDVADGKWERERSPSPELARMSALVTRPPKPKSISKMQPLSPLAHTVLPMADPPNQTPPILQPSLVIPKKQATTTCSTGPKLKTKDVPKKTRENQVVKETVGFYFDNDGNQVWICPACKGRDDGSPMIGCDGCDAWYHWVCVGIQLPPDSSEWFCRNCISKKDELVGEKKKKIRKRKAVA